METKVLKEPVIMSFDPNESDDVKLKEVFGDDLTRSLWLMIRPGHMVDQYFNDWCLEIALVIKNKKPNNLEDLHKIIRSGGYLSDNWEESKEWLERLMEVINGSNPFNFAVEI